MRTPEERLKILTRMRERYRRVLESMEAASQKFEPDREYFRGLIEGLDEKIRLVEEETLRDAR